MASVLTSQQADFPRWYQDVVAKAGLAENGPVRGTMVIKPWGYAIWELMQAGLDARIKATGHDNVYFPLFIPESFLAREAEHVEGFAPELAVVTRAGGSELTEPVIVRPTSETLFGHYMARWIQSFRDLPLLLNQWCNIVRWELRPRLLLRTTEFLWQEGHTAHADQASALGETLKILHDVYGTFMRDDLAFAPILGEKTRRETFAGADTTFALEGLMVDGKALQLGTSHYMGQNFARVFDILYTAEDGERRLCHTTSWGASTRMLGGLVMTHGDDYGLRLPPTVAPVQVAVLAVKDEAAEAAGRLTDELAAAGLRARLDADTHTSFGRRAVDWELKGVPVRVEIGPRDLAAGQAVLVRRDLRTRETVPVGEVVARATALLAEVQRHLAGEARERTAAMTTDATATGDPEGPGFFRFEWDALGTEGEAALAERGFSVRCLTTADGGVPDREDRTGLVAWAARAY